jgi:hypothetical protein
MATLSVPVKKTAAKLPTILIVEPDQTLFSKIANTIIDELRRRNLGSDSIVIRKAVSFHDANSKWQEHRPVAVSTALRFSIKEGESPDPTAGIKLYQNLTKEGRTSEGYPLNERIILFCPGKEGDTARTIKPYLRKSSHLPKIVSQDDYTGVTSLVKILIDVVGAHKMDHSLF